jgi:hypothetical protein
VLESASAATDLDLISCTRAIPDTRMRRDVCFLAWYLLLVAQLGILRGRQSVRELERSLLLTEKASPMQDVTTPCSPQYSAWSCVGRHQIPRSATSSTRLTWRPFALQGVTG